MPERMPQLFSVERRKLSAEESITYFEGRNKAAEKYIEINEGEFKEPEEGTEEFAKKRYNSIN